MIDEATLARVHDILEENGDGVVTTSSLMTKTGLSRRELQKAIHKLRLEGALICSTTAPPGGYWLADSPEAAQGFVDSMSRRGRAVFAAASAARRFVKQQAEDDH